MKKLLLLTIFVLSSSLLATAQGTWSPRTSLPDSSRGYAIGFSIGNYGYVGLGTHNGRVNYPCLKDFWQFDPSTNSWTRKTDFPGKARICPATFVIGNYAYIVTGQISDSIPVPYTTECWQYNPANDTWTKKANFPGSARAYDVGFSIGGKGFVGIGSDYYANFCKDFWEYDSATDSWKQIADFGGIGRLAASGFSVGNKGYVCLGRDSLGKWKKDLWEYDTGANTWTQKNNYPGYPAFGASGFVIANNIYMGTTQDSNGSLDNRFWKYNTVSDTWFQEKSYPGHLRTICSAFSVRDTGYLGLGVYDSADICFNDFYKFNPDSSTSVNEVSGENEKIIVYPNPFAIQCYITIPDASNETSKLAVYDMQGRLVNVKTEKAGNYFILNRTKLQAGVYLLSVICRSNTYYTKLIIAD